MRIGLAFAGAWLACGNDRGVPADARPDAFVQPALALLGAQMDGTTSLAQMTFTGSDCEVVDGCVGGSGVRDLVVFDTVAENVGTGDLDLGVVPADGSSAGVYTWDVCTAKHLVTSYVEQTISDATGAVVAVGHKEAFCVEDTEQVEPRASHGYTCDHMGITVGWADVYSHATPCQWVDVTGLPSGAYTLTVTLDPTNEFPGADPPNNVWTAPITL